MLQAEAGLRVPYAIIFKYIMRPISATHIKLGQKIKQLRAGLSLTQEELAFKVGVDRSYMGFIERGEKNPTLSTLMKIAKVLKTPLPELFG